MANNLRIILTTNKNNLVAFAAIPTAPSSWFYRKLSELIQQLGLGAFQSNMKVVPNLVAASGTVAPVSVVNADTLTIGGVVLTCATGTQDGTHFKPGASDVACGANIATCINANTTLSKCVSAVANTSTGVVTVTCLVPGVIGNVITLAASAHMTVGAALTSGTEGTTATYVHGL